jgi:Rap1a immunity proteins
MKTLTTTFILIASILSLAPTVYAQKDLPVDDASTAAFIELCKNPDDAQGRSFCFGFGEGVYQGYLANRRADAKPTICFVNKSETRNEVLQKYLAWTKANPQFNKESAAKSLMRFFNDKYPCK